MSTTSPRLSDLIADLKSVARDAGGDAWGDVAERLEAPRRTHAEVNLSQIERYAAEGETVVVPGKVLGGGALRKDVTVAAVDFSSSAETKIEATAAETQQIEAALEANPEAANVRVIR